MSELYDCVFIDIVLDSFLIIGVHSFDIDDQMGQVIWGRPFRETMTRTNSEPRPLIRIVFYRCPWICTMETWSSIINHGNPSLWGFVFCCCCCAAFAQISGWLIRWSSCCLIFIVSFNILYNSYYLVCHVLQYVHIFFLENVHLSRGL